MHRPGALQAAGHRVAGVPLATLVLPAEPLVLDPGGGGLGPEAAGGRVRAVRLAEGVTAGDERDGLLIVHRHAAERFADVLRGSQRIGIAVGPLGVHVDQAHLHRRQRLLQLPVAAVALVGEELLLGPPVDQIGLPVVRPPAAEAEGLEAHGLQRDVAGQDHQIAPGDLLAVLLLDRPQQAPRLVEVAVVRPAVERLEALLGAAGAAAPVHHPVGPGAVPGHPDEERPVVAVVGRPPLLRGGEDLLDVLLDRVEVEAREGLGVVELFPQRVGLGRVLPQRRQVELIGPPELVWFRPVRTAGRSGCRR